MRVLVLAVLLVSAAGLTAAGAQLISSEPHPSQSAPSLAKVWGDIPEEKRERIEDYLRMKLGLSSTGRLQLMGVYRVDSPDPTAKTLEVKTRDGRSISLSLVDVQWSHYWGYDEQTSPRVEELTNAELDSACNHTEGSCWRSRDFRLDFPS